MTTTLPGPGGQNLFSMFSGETDGTRRMRREAFALSLLGQGLVVISLMWLTMFPPASPPFIGVRPMSRLRDMLPLVFSGRGGGGGGSHDVLRASHGPPPPASLETQLAPPIVVPNESVRLPVQATVMVAPDVALPQGTQIGDPTSKELRWLSNGRGGPGGTGDGCCNGDGPGHGTGIGPGPGGVHIPGVDGVTVPRAIYSPEPSFSEEARRTKTQGIVTLVLVVGADGRPHNIHVQNSLGMGLDERAITAVNNWKFAPATLHGQAVATQIAVEVNFRLY